MRLAPKRAAWAFKLALRVMWKKETALGNKMLSSRNFPSTNSLQK